MSLRSVYRIHTMAALLQELEPAPDLVDRAYSAVLGAIASGALAPGERLKQEDLALRLNVSRQPVLQALRLLKNEGLLEDAPGRGLQVVVLDTARLVHTYQVRGALDALAARLAAERRSALPAALLKAGRAARKSGDVQALIDADIQFHRALYAASGNPCIERSAQAHWAHIRCAMGAVLQHHRLRHPVWDEHQAIADAVARGDGVQAEAAAAAHAKQAGQTMAQHLLPRHNITHA
jgi:DNA-binding GntR family transcriptional regulator